MGKKRSKITDRKEPSKSDLWSLISVQFLKKFGRAEKIFSSFFSSGNGLVCMVHLEEYQDIRIGPCSECSISLPMLPSGFERPLHRVSYPTWKLQPRIFRGWSTNQFEQVLGLQMSNSSQKLKKMRRNKLVIFNTDFFYFSVPKKNYHSSRNWTALRQI